MALIPRILRSSYSSIIVYIQLQTQTQPINRASDSPHYSALNYFQKQIIHSIQHQNNKNQLFLMDIEFEESSRESNNFKTIVSESETRNPTTNKKKRNLTSKQHTSLIDDHQYLSAHCNRFKNHEHSSFENRIKKMSMDQLEEEIYLLEKSKAKNIFKKKYNSVNKLQMKKELCLKELNKKRKSMAEEYHQTQQNQLYDAHQEQLSNFEETWRQIFENQFRRERKLQQKIMKQKQQDIRRAGEELSQKAKEIQKKYDRKMHDSLKQSEYMEKSMLKMQRYQLLANMDVLKECQMKKRQLKKERSYLIENLREKQEKKLQEKYDRKFKSLNMKMKEQRDTQLKIYHQNEDRLKKKFQICLNKLKKNQQHQIQNFLKNNHI